LPRDTRWDAVGCQHELEHDEILCARGQRSLIRAWGSDAGYNPDDSDNRF
jgi:hypothetical protein